MDRQACRDAGINYEEGVARFVGNAEMYERFLGEFVNDGTFAELETAMKAGNVKDAFAAVWQTAQQHQVSLRTATFIVACTRILKARELRGLYP